MTIENLSCSDFVHLVGQTFKISHGENSAEMTLTEAVETSTQAPENCRLPFSLVFQLAPGTSLVQSTFDVHHDEIGTHQLFMVPIQPNQEGPRLEASFG